MSKKNNDVKPVGNVTSPIRTISKDEVDKRRRWPSEKQLASSNEFVIPEPGQKNRIHSVLVALPVLMLMIGLWVYFQGESKQINGEPILSELVTREGEFKSVSTVSGVGKARYYLWYTDEERSRGVRVSEEQKALLSELVAGDALVVEAAPTVEGSNTLWAHKVSHDGEVLISP